MLLPIDNLINYILLTKAATLFITWPYLAEYAAVKSVINEASIWGFKLFCFPHRIVMPSYVYIHVSFCNVLIRIMANSIPVTGLFDWYQKRLPLVFTEHDRTLKWWNKFLVVWLLKMNVWKDLTLLKANLTMWSIQYVLVHGVYPDCCGPGWAPWLRLAGWWSWLRAPCGNHVLHSQISAKCHVIRCSTGSLRTRTTDTVCPRPCVGVLKLNHCLADVYFRKRFGQIHWVPFIVACGNPLSNIHHHSSYPFLD